MSEEPLEVRAARIMGCDMEWTSSTVMPEGGFWRCLDGEHPKYMGSIRVTVEQMIEWCWDHSHGVDTFPETGNIALGADLYPLEKDETWQQALLRAFVRRFGR